MMKEILALLLHAPTDSLGLLKLDLENQSIKVNCLRSLEEALPLLNGVNPPHLVFTETALPDGTWADVVTLAVEASKPVNVIVIGRLEDVGLYLETITRGAFDFIVLPLTGHELVHVVRCAADNVISRREAQARAAIPGPAARKQISIGSLTVEPNEWRRPAGLTPQSI